MQIKIQVRRVLLNLHFGYTNLLNQQKGNFSRY